MPRPELLARFAEFSGGHFGKMAARRAEPNMFTGRNVAVYPDGSIGPRCGMLDLAWEDGPSDPVSVAVVQPGTATVPDRLLFAVDKTFYAADVWQDGEFLISKTVHQPTTGGSGPAKPISDIIVPTRRYAYFTAYDDTTFFFDSVAMAYAALSGAPGGKCLAVWGEFLVVGNTANGANRLEWSAPVNFGSWPATNFLLLGIDATVIVAMRVVRDTLYVFCENGEIFVLTGTLGVNVVVRQFLQGEITSGPWGPAGIDVDRDGVMWWMRPGPDNSAVPVAFNGSHTMEAPMQDDWLDAIGAASTGIDVGTLAESRTVVFGAAGDPGGSAENYRLLLLRDGAWTGHETTVLKTGGADEVRMVAGARGEVYLLWHEAEEGETHLFAWMVECDQPAIQMHGSGTDDGDGGAPDAEFTTAELVAKDGNEYVVQFVDIVFTTYPTGSDEKNHFKVVVNVIDAAESPEPQTSDVGTFDEAPGSAIVPQRKRFTFNTRAGRGFSISVRDLRGVKIDEILVWGLKQEPRL